MKKIKYGYLPTLGILVLFQFGASGIYAYIMYLTGSLTDLGMAKNLSGMIEVSKVIVFLGLVTFIIKLILVYFEFTYIQRSMVQLKHRFIDDVLVQDIINLQKDKVPALFSNLTNDFDRYEAKFMRNITFLAWAVSQVVWAVLLIGTVSPWIAVVPLVLLVFFWNFGQKSSKPIKKKEKVKSESLKSYTNYINETVQGYEVIKQHQLEEVREKKFLEHAVEVQKDNYQVDVVSTKVEAKNSFLITLLVMGLVVVGMIYSSQNNVSFGSVVVIFAAFSMVMWPIGQFGRVLAEMGGVSEVLRSFKEQFKVSDHQRERSVKSFESLKFNHTDLGYKDETILEDVSLEVEAGEKVLIVGPSGAGKSTILKTIRQTTPALTGSVTFNGIDISQIVPIDYYSMFSTVDQIGFLFSGKLKDNITLYQEVSDKKVQSVMNEVGLGSLDLQMDIQNDGGNLSGGQRARVLLARALTLDSQIIVCDEILASLDVEVACAIESDLLELHQTTINVSHIFFSENLVKYDKIYVVDDNSVHLARSVDEVQERMLEFQMKEES